MVEQDWAPDKMGPFTVIEVVDGDTVVLDDRTEVRLTGIQAPKLPLGRKDFPTWPLAPEARAALEEMCLNKQVMLHFTGRREDRHGRRLAQIIRADDKLWLQGEMVRRGLARAYSFADNRARAEDLLDLERGARNAGFGIWALPYYAIRNAANASALHDEHDTFQLVEGTVQKTARVRDRIYLNFGEDYRRDFTIVITARDWGYFERAGWTLDTLAGQRLRVRGWLQNLNGPMIEIDHPEALERLEVVP